MATPKPTYAMGTPKSNLSRGDPNAALSTPGWGQDGRAPAVPGSREKGEKKERRQEKEQPKQAGRWQRRQGIARVP